MPSKPHPPDRNGGRHRREARPGACRCPCSRARFTIIYRVLYSLIITSDYGYWDFLDGKPVRRALAEMKLKSAIARPRVYETLPPNQTYIVFGAAWAGETEVTEIAVSTDGGQTWAEAHFLDPARPHAWRRWKFDWLTPRKPGQYTLLARAKDANGSVQPDKHDSNYDSYVINHPLPIEVFVGDPTNTS